MEEEDFKVVDKRRFTQDGKPATTEEVENKEEVEEEEPMKGGDEKKTDRDLSALPPLDFASFVLSLGSSVFVVLRRRAQPNYQREGKKYSTRQAYHRHNRDA